MNEARHFAINRPEVYLAYTISFNSLSYCHTVVLGILILVQDMAACQNQPLLVQLLVQGTINFIQVSQVSRVCLSRQSELTVS